MSEKIAASAENAEDNSKSMLKKKMLKKKKKKLERAKNFQSTPTVLNASEKLQRKTSWKKTTLKIVAVVLVGVALGCILGNWYKGYVSDSGFDYSPYKLADYEMNQTEVLRSILQDDAQAGKDFSNLVSTLKSQSKTPKDLSVSQNIALAELNASKATSYSVIGLGKVDTLAPQNVTSKKLFDGNTYTFESLSEGILHIATCAVMDKDTPHVDLYKGKNLKYNSQTGFCTADWGQDKTSYTLKKYVDQHGMELSRLVPYVISSKTILEEEKVEIVESTWNEKTVYEFTLRLDPVTSVLRYYKQVMKTSDLEDAPKFDDVTLKIIIDADWNYVRTEAVENYSILYGKGSAKINAPCGGTLNSDFVFNQSVTLPSFGGEQ